MPNEEMMALMGARQASRPQPQVDNDMMMPMGSDKATGEVFLDRALKGDLKCKKGDTVMVKGTITSLGSKIGFSPSEITYHDEEGGESEDGGDEEYDEDLDSDITDKKY